MPILNLTVNGTPHEIEISPSRSLAEVLRYDLGLTGTKIGCNEAECGACTVIVNGNSVDSCIYPALKAQKAEVLTIEGMAAQWRRGTGGEGRRGLLAPRSPAHRSPISTPSNKPSSPTAPPSAASARPA